MKKSRLFLLSLFIIGLFVLPSAVTAQDLRFEVPASEVEVYLEEDGTLSVWYLIEFQNMAGAAPIDYVDIGMPTSDYSLKNIEATVDGQAVTDIESSPYVTNGFALGLGDNAIQAGQFGTVTVWIPGVQNVLYPYEGDDQEAYVSFQFSPSYFDSEFDRSTNTEYRVTIILPPDVDNEEGVYYYPENWPGTDEPDDIGRTAEDDRVYYSWFTDNANAHTQYIFGAAFPNQYVPADAIVTKPDPSTPSQTPGSSPGIISSILGALGGNICCFGFGLIFIAIFGFSIYQGTVGAQKRKMSYLPPKMKIEGNGIKRGLTAVEAAIIMEQPMDKVLTMILFSTLKKEAAVVTQQDPLELEVSDPLPDNLHAYEVEFLEAFKQPAKKRRAAMQEMIVNLVKGVENKMKGFSRKETIAYYEDIMRRAWLMVEEADTPEVKSENYNQTLEWTMLDDDYQERTRRTFTGRPVFVPMWWPRYSPSYRRSIGGGVPTTASRPAVSTGKPGSSGGGVSLPSIPGSTFAANVINGATGMAAGVVGNLTSFTDGITSRTNPIPVSTRTKSGSGGFRGGGGSSCACACACAGCACACAGGGR
ncbi:MAG: hypothetical protein SVP52_07450 [Chloroflexota bacterium]|nr:hypothetical protein [Chloroflexota bacterium]